MLQPIVLLFGGSNRDENRHQTDFCPLKQGTAAQFVIGGYSFRFCMRFQILMFLRFYPHSNIKLNSATGEAWPVEL